MFERVLYPTDFSEVSLNSMREYLPCLRELGVRRFLVLHVIDITTIDFEAFKIQKSLKERLKKVVEDLGPGIETDVRIGIPSIEIGEAAEEWGADMIVLPSVGENVWRLTFIGNTASNICRMARRPVLVLKHGKNGTIPIRCRDIFKRPLVALDFSSCSLRIIETVKKFEDIIESGTLIHSIDYGKKSELERNVISSKEKLKNTINAFNAHFEIEVFIGTASQAIIGAALVKESTLIVIGKKGRNFLKDLLLGSTAERVLRDSDVPVLLVPCPKR